MLLLFFCACDYGFLQQLILGTKGKYVKKIQMEKSLLNNLDIYMHKKINLFCYGSSKVTYYITDVKIEEVLQDNIFGVYIY